MELLAVIAIAVGLAMDTFAVPRRETKEKALNNSKKISYSQQSS